MPANGIVVCSCDWEHTTIQIIASLSLALTTRCLCIRMVWHFVVKSLNTNWIRTYQYVLSVIFFWVLNFFWIVPDYKVGCGSLCLGVIWSNLCLRYCAVVRNFWRVVERRKPTRLSEDGLRNSQYFSDNHEIFAWIVQNVCQLLWTISSLTGTALKAYFHRSKDRVWIENIHFMFRTQNSNLFGKFFTKVYGNWFSYVVRRVRDSSHERIDHDSGLVYSEIFIKWNIREKSSVRYDTFVSRTRSRARRSNTQWKKQWFP